MGQPILAIFCAKKGLIDSFWIDTKLGVKVFDPLGSKSNGAWTCQISCFTQLVKKAYLMFDQSWRATVHTSQKGDISFRARRGMKT